MFSVLNGIEIKENLGRGDRIANTIFVTNDLSTKRQIVMPFFEPVIGSFEYDAVFKETSLLAYSIPSLPIDVGKEHNLSHAFLHQLIFFAKWTWLYQDHAISVGNGYLSANGRIFIDYPEGEIWRSDGTQEKLLISRDKLRELRNSHKRNWTDIDLDRLEAVPTKERSTRVSRAFHYVTNAMFSQLCIDKLVHYCSALEALFATGRGELVHLLAERTAVVSSNDADQRHLNYQQVRDAYKLRSAYTHGEVISRKKADAVADMSKALDAIVRTCINRILSDRDLYDAMLSDADLDAWCLKALFS
jgi:hypothetical protein